ncbi:MAG TPA: transporter substrate-binding domain-containing protein [Clostridiales bacterium]|nr:transporter substrate-binding domain-containing protein [Clostridiales bacterium]
MNSFVEVDQLADKTFAAVKGGVLPEGIKEENTLYFDTREDSLNAVESGKADYGYWNPYSIAYYTLLNSYDNIVTVPIGRESREYCIGILSDDEILLLIINKSLSSIDANQMQTLILDVSSHIDRKVTLSMVLDTYGIEITIAVSITLSILLLSMFSSMRASKSLENKIESMKSCLKYPTNTYMNIL